MQLHKIHSKYKSGRDGGNGDEGGEEGGTRREEKDTKMEARGVCLELGRRWMETWGAKVCVAHLSQHIFKCSKGLILL